MDNRGFPAYLGHRPCSKESTLDTSWFPTLSEMSQRDWTQYDRSGPFAHLTEALNGIYSVKTNALMRERSMDIDLAYSRCSDAENDKFGTVEASISNSTTATILPRNPTSREISPESWSREQKFDYSGDGRGPSKWGDLTCGRRKIERRGFDRCLGNRKGGGLEESKGVYAFPDAYVLPQNRELEPKMKDSSGSTNTASTQISLQIKLKKSGLSRGIVRASSSSREEATKVPVEDREQWDDVWEYDFSQDPLPDLLSVGPSVHRNGFDTSLEFKSACSKPNRSTARFSSSKFCTVKFSSKATSRISSRPTVWSGWKKTRNRDSENEKASNQRNYSKSEWLKRDQSQRGQVIKQLLCGGFAGVISRSAVAPLDLIKAHLITSHGLLGAQKSALTICKDIVKQSGWQGLFRGNFVNCVRVAPNKAIELFVFETVRRTLNKEDHPLRNLAATIAGGAAGMAGTIATYPLELVRTRLSVQPDLYTGPLQALAKIMKEEGFISFYSGLSPSLVGVFPYAATNYFVYDGLRTTYCRSTGRLNVPTIPTLVFGAVSAAASSTVTYPLEVARRQMQLALVDGVAKRSTVRIIQDIYRNEGFFALYRGLGTTWLKLIPAAGISFMCYEAARLALHIDDASIVKPEEVSNMEEQEFAS